MGFLPTDLPPHVRAALGCATPTQPPRKPRGTGRTGRAKREACAATNRVSTADAGEGWLNVRIDGLQVVSEANRRDHWAVRRDRVNRQKLYVTTALREHADALPPLPVTVRFVRFGPKALDTDNLAGAFKACRDSLAKVYGVGDAPGGPITWAEPQQSAGWPYAVAILIWSGDAAAPLPAGIGGGR